MSTKTKHTPLPWALAKTGVVGSLLAGDFTELESNAHAALVAAISKAKGQP